MKTIVVGDIHGCYEELKELIIDLEEKQEYNKDTDRLIFLGDYIDRGEDSYKVIQYIKELQKNNSNVIALMGNHEKMCIDFMTRNEDNWLNNGYYTTLKSYGSYQALSKDVEWMQSLPMYYEDEHCIYVHAGMNPRKPLSQNTWYELLWQRESFIYDFHKFYKKVIFGHTPSQLLLKKDKPYQTTGGNIGIDTGCVFGGNLTALVLVDGEVTKFYQVSNEKFDEDFDE
jgi:serine/threonine protein phosphatase 1